MVMPQQFAGLNRRSVAKYVLLTGLLLRPVYAAPPPDADPHSAVADWFHSLQDRDGMGCCSIADCRHYRTEIVDGHYYILWQAAWIRVPDEAVLPRFDNPTGQTIACVQATHWTAGEFDGPIVRCFVRAPGM